MLAVQNNTPFSTTLLPSLDKHGHSFAIVIIKGTFTIHRSAPALVISEEQLPLQTQDVFYGDPNKTSVKYEADIAPIKVSPDIILVGHAYAPLGRQTSVLDARLQIGAHKKNIRVFGDRFWQRDNLAWQTSRSQTFERIALTYENAFGGTISSAGEIVEFCPFNPIGKGFAGHRGQGLHEGLALPNLENPVHLIQNWDDEPAPVGFGFVGRSWQPRIKYAGTYNQLWQQERMPLLPLDFDEKYYNGAHPDLQLNSPLVGGEDVIATNLSESGLLKFSLPRYRFIVTVTLKGKNTGYQPLMDTVLIEPDENRVQLTWRIAVPCARQFLHIDKIALDWRSM